MHHYREVLYLKAIGFGNLAQIFAHLTISYVLCNYESTTSVICYMYIYNANIRTS